MTITQTNANAGDVNNFALPSVFLLTSGDGSDGDEWSLIGIYSTMEKAEAAKRHYEGERKRPDGSTYRMYANEIEEWGVE